MSDGFYLDNDVVLKSCAYGEAQDLVELTTTDGLRPAILSLAQFTMRSRIARSKILIDPERAASNLEVVIAKARLLEPSDAEIEWAADLEELATAANMSFDAGESQLVAMLLSRTGVSFVTGDKRAARAMHVILPEIRRRIICFEQVLRSVLGKSGLEPLRTSVCIEKTTDRAVTNCFQCSSTAVEIESVLSALTSYTKSLRGETGDLLVETDDMSGAKVS